MTLGGGVFSVYLSQYTGGAWVNTDYTNYCVGYTIKKRLNSLDYVEMDFIGITTAAAKADFTQGNVVKILAGTTLVSKITLDQPQFNRDGSVKVRGYQSCGTWSSGILTKSLLATMPATEFNGHTESDCISSTTSSHRGIRIDADGGTILDIDGTDTGDNTSTKKIHLRFNGELRHAALTSLCEYCGSEWWITHGSDPYTATDTLHVSTRKGNDASVMTFYGSGTNQNIVDSTGNKDVDRIVNDVIFTGMNDWTNTLTSEAFMSSPNYTYITTPPDTWLYADCGKTDTDIQVYDNGNPITAGDTIKIDNETITVGGTSGSGTHKHLTGCTRAVGATNTAHPKESDVIRTTAAQTITVNSTSGFANSGSLYIGTETVSYTGKGATTFTGCTRAASSSTAYSHGYGVHVVKAVSKYSAEATSDILVYGLKSKTYSDSGCYVKHSLDRKARNYLIAMSQPPYRIGLWVANPYTVVRTVVVGDDITINSSSNINVPDGDYRVIGIDLILDDTWKCYLHLNRHGIRTLWFESSLNFSQQNYMDTQFSYQRPLSYAFNALSNYINKDTNNTVELISSYGDVQITATDDVAIDASDDIAIAALDNLDIQASGYIEILNFATGDDDIEVWNRVATKGIILRTGSNTSATYIEMQNSSADTLFHMGGDGVLTINDINTASTRYISLYHNGVDGHVTTSYGDLHLEPTGGDVVATGNVMPASAGNYNLGSSGTDWDLIYCNALDADDDITSNDNIKAGTDGSGVFYCQGSAGTGITNQHFISALGYNGSNLVYQYGEFTFVGGILTSITMYSTWYTPAPI